MLEKIQLNRPSLAEIPNALRLYFAAQKAKSNVELSPADMDNAGLFATLREGTWMYLAQENLLALK